MQSVGTVIAQCLGKAVFKLLLSETKFRKPEKMRLRRACLSFARRTRRRRFKFYALQQKGIVGMKTKLCIVTRMMLALFMAALTLSAARAQTSTTGTIEGTVMDVNGAAVPGVTVTVTSPNLITPQTATTNDEGRYRILNLPPGRYVVAVAASQGFAEFKQENVEVNLSRTSSVEVRLQPAGASASLTVTDTSGAAVDVTTNTTGTNVSTEQFSNFPTQRTVQSIYTIAPTAVRSGLRDASGRERDPSVGGSSGPENNYILDGINTTDPAFGGSGANLPFEFVQEVEIKTGAFGAEYGRATGGIFNVITKSGGNDFRGDAFAYFTTKSLVRETRNFSNTGAAPNGFSEIDAGFDIGGPIKKDKIWFFGAFNPQRRKNFYLSQTLRQPLENEATTPFYAGKITWAINNTNVFTFSTFADYTKIEGFQANTGSNNPLTNVSGFGANINQSFNGRQETGGTNYAFRLNSTITPNMIGEFSFGLHKQRNNLIPSEGLDVPSTIDNFALVVNNNVLPVTQTSIFGAAGTGNVDFVYAPGATLARNYIRAGFDLYSTQDRNRWEMAARLQNIWGKHTFKYGFEFNRSIYNIDQQLTGPQRTYPDPNGLVAGSNDPTLNTVNGIRITNNFGVCAVQGNTLVCPTANLTNLALALIAGGGAPTGITAATLNAGISATALSAAPFLLRVTTRVRDFELHAPNTYTSVESFYVQDDYKIARNVQVNAGLRWDYQQAAGNAAGGGTRSYLKLNSFMDNLQPRIGLTYDFTGQGKGKLYINYARYLETPIPLDVNVRAGSDNTQTDKNFNVNRLNAPAGAAVLLAIGNLGANSTPVDADLKPPTVNEATAGIEYEIVKDLALGARAVYRAQGTVIEDGSFDNGTNYFLFNPGESSTERLARTPPVFDAAGNQIGGGVGQGFGRARRYYRALEVSATKRFSNNYQFIASYVFSSLIGNYEGLYRNDNGQQDPNISSLFDLVGLLNNTYGRLPNDRPHVFKFDGSYQTPFRLLVGGSFRAQSGIPFNQGIPDPSGTYTANNEGFAVPRGTAINPVTGRNRTPTIYNLDLNAYYPIKLGENRQLRFQVDWFNVFNSQRALTEDITYQINSGIPNAGFGANSLQFLNPFYGRGVFFQFPSSLRLGVKFQF
jgi:outer membrane receptor protein involved in Fe transport